MGMENKLPPFSWKPWLHLWVFTPWDEAIAVLLSFQCKSCFLALWSCSLFPAALSSHLDPTVLFVPSLQDDIAYLCCSACGGSPFSCRRAAHPQSPACVAACWLSHTWFGALPISFLLCASHPPAESTRKTLGLLGYSWPGSVLEV